MSDCVQNFFTAEDKLLNYFGYSYGSHIYHPESALHYYWVVIRHSVIFSDIPFTAESIESEDKIYKEEISLNDLYRKGHYTGIPVNTCTGDNAFMIFDNKKECKDPEILSILKEQY